MEEEGRPQKSKRKNADTAGLVQVHPSLFVMDENPMEFYVAKCDAQRTIQEMIKVALSSLLNFSLDFLIYFCSRREAELSTKNTIPM